MMALGHGHYDPISHEPVHEHGAVVARESASIREPFGIAQALAIAIGIFFIVTGAVGLARTGTSSPTSDRTEVAELSMTGLLAIIHLGIGILAALGATTRGAARGILFFLGPALIAAGIIAIIQPVAGLGWNEVVGVAYLIIGVAALVAAIVTPVETFSERRVTSA